MFNFFLLFEFCFLFIYFVENFNLKYCKSTVPQGHLLHLGRTI